MKRSRPGTCATATWIVWQSARNGLSTCRGWQAGSTPATTRARARNRRCSGFIALWTGHTDDAFRDRLCDTVAFADIAGAAGPVADPARRAACTDPADVSRRCAAFGPER